MSRAMGDPALFERARSYDKEWIGVAEAWGFSIIRELGAFVSTRGDGAIRVAPYEDLDPDDCLAQIVLHELCHHCVEGPASRHAADWGLDNVGDADVAAEHAALRMQAALSDRFGLRSVLAPTTDFRAFYDALPTDPLDAAADVDEVARARVGLARLDAAPARDALLAAMERLRVGLV